MLTFLKKYKIEISLGLLILIYIVYFSFFTILRYKTLYASYFDLGIMHQTVFNTYRAITTHDWSRILELTNPFGYDQIKRMAIHNDLLLAVISPLYILYSGPETLLILQTIILALGAIAVFLLSKHIFSGIKSKISQYLPLLFAFAYLMYGPMQRANIFDFHAVTFSTTLLLFMFYFWLMKRYTLCFVFFVLSLLSKEQVALITLFFGLYTIWNGYSSKKNRNTAYSFLIIFISLSWFLISFYFIIPYFRGNRHFALSYYGDFGDSPTSIFFGFFKNPSSVYKYIFHIDTFRYFLFLLGPLAFTSLLSLPQLLIAFPEFAINLFSNNWNMRNIIYHYTSVIQPFIFISAMYGVKQLFVFMKKKKMNHRWGVGIMVVLIGTTLLFAFTKGPLPLSREKEVYPLLYPSKEMRDAQIWKDALKDESLKISSTGNLAPFFTSRRYFYTFSPYYYMADYLVLDVKEIYNGWERERLVPVYKKLIKDTKYQRIYKNEKFEVYKKNQSASWRTKLKI
jgi:uncharacterized membrane protein